MSPQAPTLQHQMPQAPSVLAKWKLSLLPECQAFGLASSHAILSALGALYPFSYGNILLIFQSPA